ncbi:MBOAT family O-acyltransferase [Turicibacter bilis]|uniref:MBOAT family O-acyltransferase n=1 Tax=Turicibacter bilis TaxID=2735723 RepID=UPI0031BB621A
MLFSSTVFIFYFLPITLLIYFMVPKKLRNYVLLISSLVFYAWGGLLYFPLLIISIILNYICGLKIGKYENKPIKKKRVLITSIILNVLFLGIFKYTNFIVDNLNALFNTSIFIVRIPLPIGISFYTFQAMSYVIDVYRGEGKVQKNIFNLALYISMFPQLVAGPIVRYQTIDEQIINRKHSFEKFNDGLNRFIVGLFKKIIISNTVGELSTIVYGMTENTMSVSIAWLGAISYMLQIYFDFSGYSDMAIGLGKIFGFDFLENFNYPYISKSVSEFWRRWHISLGSWFRDYIYIPLGGNRVSSLKIYRNLLVVWLVTGIWHGASWNFVIWGLYFGMFIMLERMFLQKLLNRIPTIMQHIYLLLIVLVGWVIFSQSDLSSTINYLEVMFGLTEAPFMNGYTIFYFKEYFVALLIACICSMPILKVLRKNDNFNRVTIILKPVVICVMFFIVIIYMVNSTFNPFIYFNF